MMQVYFPVLVDVRGESVPFSKAGVGVGWISDIQC